MALELRNGTKLSEKQPKNFKKLIKQKSLSDLDLNAKIKEIQEIKAESL